MRKAMKNQGKVLLAYQLGANTHMEQELLAAGKILLRQDGRYELFSQEAVHGQGELGNPGDFFKVDSTGAPYPNQREWFLAHHRHLQGDQYEQLPTPVEIWQVADGPCSEVSFLLDNGLLRLDEQDEAHYFNAHLWGAPLSARKDAVLVFYSIGRDEQEKITSADFNFVAWDEFQKTYHLI